MIITDRRDGFWDFSVYVSRPTLLSGTPDNPMQVIMFLS